MKRKRVVCPGCSNRIDEQLASCPHCGAHWLTGYRDLHASAPAPLGLVKSAVRVWAITSAALVALWLVSLMVAP